MDAGCENRVEYLPRPRGVRCDGETDALLRRLLVEAAPVFTGDKPAMLVKLQGCSRAGAGGKPPCVGDGWLSRALGLPAFPLRATAAATLLFFYDEALLAASLAKPGVREFLAAFGYRTSSGIPELLGRLAAATRRTARGFPHEIGLFLGYPLKDVAGFISRETPPAPVRGAAWRVFAPVGESAALAERIARAKDAMIRRLALETDALRICPGMRAGAV